MVGGLPESPGPPSGTVVSGGVFLWFIGQQCAGPRADSRKRRAGPGSRAAGDSAPGTSADRAQGHRPTAGLLQGHKGPGDGRPAVAEGEQAEPVIPLLCPQRGVDTSPPVYPLCHFAIWEDPTQTEAPSPDKTCCPSSSRNPALSYL